MIPGHRLLLPLSHWSDMLYQTLMPDASLPCPVLQAPGSQTLAPAVVGALWHLQRAHLCPHLHAGLDY